MQTTPPRANDPETHLPYPQATLFEKLAGWAWKKWGRKLNVKLAVMAAPVIGMVASYLGHTPDAQQAIGIGLSAMVLGALDIAISYATTKLHLPDLESAQKISEEDQTTASELNWKEIFAAPAVPIEPRFKPLTIGGWTKPEGESIPATSRFGFSVEYESQGRKLTETFGTIGEAISFRDEVRLRKGHSSANIIKP